MLNQYKDLDTMNEALKIAAMDMEVAEADDDLLSDDEDEGKYGRRRCR